jgi:hypothetical protein
MDLIHHDNATLKHVTYSILKLTWISFFWANPNLHYNGPTLSLFI